MLNIILIENPATRQNLLPLTFTRPIGNMRIGILTIKEKWEKWINAKVSYLTEAYLAVKFPINITTSNLLVNSSVLPTAAICTAIKALKKGELLTLANGTPIAYYAENSLNIADFFALFKRLEITLSTSGLIENKTYEAIE